MVPEIIELYEFNSWANRRTLEALSHLTPEDFNRDLGSSFSSMRKTLVHIVFGEWFGSLAGRGIHRRVFPNRGIWRRFKPSKDIGSKTILSCTPTRAS